MKTPEMGQLGDISPQGSIAIGVLVGLVSTSLQAIGLTLQRKSHILEDEKYPYDIRRPPYRRRRWQLGMFMFVLSNIVGSTIQITTLPLPVLSTLQASGLVFNTIFATLILGEPFTRYSFGGTILVCIGAILIAIFGAIGEPAHTLDQLLKLLGRSAFLQWIAGTAVIIVITLLGAHMLKGPSVSGWSGSWGHSNSKTHGSHHHHYHSPRLKTLRGVLYGAVSGILSAHSLLVAKTAVELLVRTILDRVNQFNRWQSWVILLGLVAIALTQLYYMHRGLKLCSTSILYPFVFCIYNIIAILDGLIYFRQTSRLSGLHAGLIALGTVILLSGVLCLSWRLEEPMSPAETGAAPAPSALTPGLGLLEERAPSPTYSGLICPSDEESYPAERQPLLLQTPSQQRTPSRRYTTALPPSSQERHSMGLANETAQIWADLYDESSTGNDSNAMAPKSPSHCPASPSTLHRQDQRQRSTSGTIPFTARHPNTAPTSPASLFPERRRSIRWQGVLRNNTSSNSRRLRCDAGSGWRRASTPVVGRGVREPIFALQVDVGAGANADVADGTAPGRPSRAREPEDGVSVGEQDDDDEQRTGAQGTWLSRLFRTR
ncbi:hypothetical protein LOY94_000671 [Ophidiomyces ophidiicola]|uniref:Uncharacterized protein n=1 Tax=Ophidiomyces ophidiicola TaxID=1387563 RepID=A0ACB8UQK3_9EURO|nr:hypothetical protein LOZ64_002217 [Ophidiomyces ophidiicola]KAI2023561.1 hypothetical protein LOZ46_001390 [Ophidiomyces ophidiicola]KAI2040926.1 hypothetical protein LOZ47_000895 [Ophidiomyces ophidiicola]KAI2072905.1 hypothetical protein LOZ40_001115 [Ophidiomyces ophidiicola]KAI2094562.1 hypothetical protein LOZ33_004528 [Ophidiomyces ophidiicola]